MVHKAILIGINYLKSEKYRLSSPINDIKIMRDFLVNYCNYSDENIYLLSDSPKIKQAASFFNIVKNLKEVGRTLGENDHLTLYFSGHGSSINDTNNDETDKKDEIFLPQDWRVSYISDDLLNSILKEYKCRTLIIFDCCNSGTMCDLKYTYDIKNMEKINNLKIKENDFSNIVCLSSSSEKKNSFEKFLDKNMINTDKNKFYGEFTIFLLHTLKQYLEEFLSFDGLSYFKLLEYLSDYLKPLDSLQTKSVAYKLKHSLISNPNIEPFISMSNDFIKDMIFLQSKENETSEKNIENQMMSDLSKKSFSSLAYKYTRLTRKVKFLERKMKEQTEKNDKLMNIVASANLRYNFGMILR